MNLANARNARLPISLLAPVFAVALGGCSGEPFVEFDDVPDTSSGGASVVGPSGGSVAQAAGGTDVVATSGSASGGSTASVGANAAGDDSGGSGGDAAAGAVGVAGAPAQLPTTVLELIDDVEGPFPTLPARDGRNGGWYSVHDESNGQVTPASAMPLQPARGASHFAAGISGGGFYDWGAQLGVSLKSPATGYDASKHCGLRFLAKGSGAGWALLVSDRSSVPQGGVCIPGSGDVEQGCYHFVGKTFAVTADWQEVKIRFEDLTLMQNPTSTRKLDPTAIYDILFNFYSPQGSQFQLLVDDLAFIENTSADCQK